MKVRKKLAGVAALMALALVAAACGSKAGSSPTATAKAFTEAVKSKDVQGMKNSMSKGSLAVMESFAKMDKKSLDEFLKEPNSSPPPATFESRNEKITGDTATLEVKDEKGKWEEIPFVKEDGQWKIAIDKAMQKGMSEMPEGGPAVNPGNPGGGEAKEGDDSKEDGGEHKDH
ncbi:MAG: hypothetical protein QOH25_1707 [Acidobacteriota bacterium]|jgi:hypothetical protein|nr:hypothetical protein [Acidobacteriota bacterium]